MKDFEDIEGIIFNRHYGYYSQFYVDFVLDNSLTIVAGKLFNNDLNNISFNIWEKLCDEIYDINL